MVFLMSFLLFVSVTALLYFFGIRFWVSPRSVVDRVLGDSVNEAQATHPSLAFHELLVKVGTMMPASPAELSTVRKRLYKAGIRSDSAFTVFYGIKGLGTVALPILMWLITAQFGVGGDNALGLVVLSAGLGFLGPTEVLSHLVKRRRRRIERALPNSLDLMVVCVESGLGLDQAVVQVSKEMQKSYPELASEFAITNLEMRHGKRRAEALRNLGDRTGIDDMKKLVSTLIQADRFGTSIAQTLRTQADFMRVTARQRAEEKAAKLGIKLVFPIFFCILPSLFVVTVGPVVVRIVFELLPMMNAG
jgi:tight adherence protein C